MSTEINVENATSPQQVLDQARETRIQATRKLVVKKIAFYGALVVALVGVERMTRI